MDVPSVPKLEWGDDITAAPGWDGNVSLDWPPFPDTESEHRRWSFESLESQNPYVLRRIGQGHPLLERNIPSFGRYPTLTEPVALHHPETSHQQVLVDSSSTDVDSRTPPFSDVRGPSIIPNLFASQWNPWLVGSSKEYGLSTPSQMKLEVARPSHSVSTYVPNSYFGTVKIYDAPGIHQLNLRLTEPMGRHWSNMRPDDRGPIEKTISLPVTKNYVLDSRDCSSIQLPFQPVAPLIAGTGQESWSKVWGLTCDTRRNHIYYADRSSNLIRCVDPEGRVIYTIGPTIGYFGDLKRPTGLAFDHNNNRLIIVDKDNHRICFFNPDDGRCISSFGQQGNSNGQFSYPWGVSVNPRNDDIAILDSRNKRIQLFDRTCNFIEKYSVSEMDAFNYKRHLYNPRGCSFDAGGNFLYVTDNGVQNLLKLTSDLSSGKKIVENFGLHRPEGVVVDKYDNVLVADSNNHCVRVFTSEGQDMGTVRGVSNRFMEYPVNLTFLAGGEKLVLLDSNAKIHIF